MEEVRPETTEEEAHRDEDRMTIGSSLRRNPQIETPAKVFPIALSLYELLLTSGVAPSVAKRKIEEVYSPPRVTAEAKRCRHLNFDKGLSFDLVADEQERTWDFTKEEERRKARRRIKEEAPYLLIGSPPCTE